MDVFSMPHTLRGEAGVTYRSLWHHSSAFGARPKHLFRMLLLSSVALSLWNRPSKEARRASEVSRKCCKRGEHLKETDFHGSSSKEKFQTPVHYVLLLWFY